MKSKRCFKRYRGLVLIINLGIMLSIAAQAQDYPLIFREIEGVAGKPLGYIRNITQDPNGYMWFSGEGEKCLYRYDGKNLTIYRQDFMDPNSLGGVDISHLYADHEGIIWVGAEGMDRFDPSTNTFTHYLHDEANKKSLSSNRVHDILKDRKGNLWVATANGLDRFDEATREFIHYRNEPGNPRSLSSNFVSKVYEDSNGVIWVATGGYPWLRPDLSDGGLNRMEPDGGFKRYLHDPEDPHSLTSNKVLSVFEDSRGVFWVGTSGDGLHTMDRETGKFERHRYDPALPEKLSRPPLPTDWRKKIDQITFITEDATGAIWFGALFGGLSRYDPKTQKVIRYKGSKSYVDGNTWNGFVSRDGVLWISEQPRLYVVDPPRKVFDNIKLGATILNFYEDEDGSMWVRSQAGLLHFDGSGKLLKRFTISVSETEEARVSELFRDRPDMFWLGTSNGLYKINIETGLYAKVDLGFTTGLINQIINAEDGFKWIATTDGGLVKFDGEKVVKRYQVVKGDPHSISSNYVANVFPEGNDIWVCTVRGISRLDMRTDKFKYYLKESKVISLYRDHAGVLWAGTAIGLFRYDSVSDSFSPAGYHSVIATDRIYGIVEDNDNNLWITTPSWVVRIDSSRQVVSQFGVQNGIETGSILSEAFKTHDGKLLVGNYVGYYQISPQDFSSIEKPPQVMITGFQANNDQVSNESAGVQIRVEKLSDVTLSHNQNNISISFAMPDYRDPDGNQFYSMLEGFDNEWRDATGDNTSRFFSLPPGNYTYRLLAYTSSGAKAEKAIAITINPPWWKTWWAYGGYSLIAIGLLFGARRIVVNQERLKANLHLEHVELEKAKEIDKVKTAFFANISHEFRTPLTLIKGPVQELMERYSQDANTKEKLGLIQRNSDLLLKLINQLLDLARLEAGSLKLESSEGDLYSFMRAIINSFESFARQTGVSLSTEVPVIHKIAVFDRSKLETILINLVNNAIKFTPAGGSVHVQARADDDSLYVSVKDTGIGISQEHQQKIFERFHQVSEAHKEVGTGIGLSLVKELVAFMKGSIEINSELGKGAEFRVVLPIELGSGQRSEVSAPQDIMSRVAISNGLDQPFGGQHRETQPEDENGHIKSSILVVEDNADLRGFIIDSLGKEFSFLEAQNGAQGFDQATLEVPTLIISDIMMPEMDGITMTGKIKKDIRTSHIPLILLTAKSTDESKLQGLQSGADDYLTKPFNKTELLLKVQNAIRMQLKLREKLRAELLSHAPAIKVLSEDEKFLNRVKDQIIERLSDEQLGVEALGRDIGLSRSQLFRKVNALTGLTVNELIRKLRLQRAEQLITQNWGPVAQVAYEVGFSNPSYFSKCFKEEFDVLPSEYYKKKEC